MKEDGVIGYGEVTLPPYLKEKPASVISLLHRIGALEIGSSAALLRVLEDENLFGTDAQGCRAGLQTALSDLLARKVQIPVHQYVGIEQLKAGITLVTVGLSKLKELPGKLQELPQSGALKLKVGHEGSCDTMRIISELDERPLFLDANQGLMTIEDALALVEAAGDRLFAMEQPFPVNRSDLQRELVGRLNVCIYGDESIQDLIELEEAVGVFNGV
ncbi:MAG: enolase C-terminal domain-like protein, partial [Flavobacteriales bacterium]